MQNTYNSFQEASDSNWDLLVQLFGNSKKFKLIKPAAINSVFDGILITKKNDKDIVILIEVKRRQFTSEVLRNEYDNALFLEKDKYTYLHNKAKKMADVPNREIKIWYLSKTSDGIAFIHDITDKDYNWITTKMNSITYAANQVKAVKKVALLNISDALFAIQTNILK